MDGVARQAPVTEHPTDAPSRGRRDGTLLGLAAAAVHAPFARRTLGELLFSLVGVALGISVIVVPLAIPSLSLLMALVAPGGHRPGQEGTAPAGGLLTILVALLVLLVLAPRIARRLGSVQRGLALRLLGERIAAPPPVQPGRGLSGRLVAGLRDGAGWRAVAYLLLRLPVAVFEGYAVFCWAAGLVDLSFPFWWRLFRNHPPDVHLDPVSVTTPFGAFQVTTFPGTFAAFAAGGAMLLAAPWIARAATSADRALMLGLLSPGRMAQRVRDLEETRALAVDDTAALLRRVERDLHDGAQARLAALAMNLGRAREELGATGDPHDLTRARQLVEVAHRSAKDALIELRDLAKGIHPPVLDNGLADALATLAAGAAIPVRLRCDLQDRPSPAIETIVYFCAAELMANAAKHSHANKIEIDAADLDGRLRLRVTDDGVGGADAARGSGLAGLALRVRTVDGRLDIASPPGGPTRVDVELPLRA